MPLHPQRTVPGWVLHVHTHLGCTGTLVYDFGDGIVCQVRVTPALASLLLALAACRKSDERAGSTVMLGDRSLEELGRLVNSMPGPGNRITAEAIGGYKRAITRLIKKALELLSVEVDRSLEAPMPILHRGYGQGYCLHDSGLFLIGVSLDELVRVVRDKEARRPHGFSHRQPPR